jgi:hypothetical protein
MRLLVAGILHLMLLTAVAFGQATGDIESIGFEQLFRPGCWTPMLVRLTPTSGAQFKGKIAVYQEDADHDHPIFTRPIALTPNASGASSGSAERTQRFWMYFIPQPDLLRDGSDPIALNRKIQVYLTDEKDKQIARLAVKDPIDELDNWNGSRSDKLVLCVTDQSRPNLGPYSEARHAIGLKERVRAVTIPIANVQSLLPENVLGYESVDAIVWFDADPDRLTHEQRAAIEEYLRRGGKLIVCHTGRPNVWEMVKRSFGPLLPVDVQSIEKVKDIDAIKRIVAEKTANVFNDDSRLPKWQDIGKGPYEYAVARTKPGSVLVETQEKDGGGDPWLVRAPYGAGCVTWVAQDLGDPALTGRSSVGGAPGAAEDFKWLYVWDRVFDWANVSQPNGQVTPDYNFVKGSYRERYSDPGTPYHLTRSFLAAMEFPGRGVAYLSLAILFFIVYWVIAGPGSYLYLAGRKRSRLSWFVYAAAALLATGATVVVVKLVLRGSAEIHHVSFVRQVPGEPTVVHTHFGLYIPRDGSQRVELKKAASDAVCYVTAYPSLTAGDEGAPPQEYEVPVFDAKAVNFPYRSTLKKLQAQWVGDMPLGIEGGAHVAGDAATLTGKLVNKTGRKLHNIYFAFRPRFMRTSSETTGLNDQMLYVPNWDPDTALDLAAEYAQAKAVGANTSPGSTVRGPIGATLLAALAPEAGWEGHWFGVLGNDSAFEDNRATVPHNFVLLSLFDHVPVSALFQGRRERYDLHRPSLRHLDISGALAAGQLVVLAETESPGPLPIPIEVEGTQVDGEGTTYYQFILPLDRSALPPPTTAPTTKPATVAEISDLKSEISDSLDAEHAHDARR